ncbi:MAG: class I SAM-dependent methyltransferase, partial [Hyphomicrobiaceae bacterium]
MCQEAEFEEINEIKADMDGIYDQRDPRGYFRELNKLDYGIPSAAKPIFQQLIGHLESQGLAPVHLLDVGSSYGVNAALLKYNLSMSELYAHWGQKVLRDVSSNEVIENDRSFFDQLDVTEDIRVTGLDVAENAVSYGAEVGLLDDGIAINLETHALPGDTASELASVDLVMSTGCVGYVTEKTFEQLLPAASQAGPPWFANFVLRMFPFDPIADSLGEQGYVTEKLAGRTFVQRKFVGMDEQTKVLGQLA